MGARGMIIVSISISILISTEAEAETEVWISLPRCEMLKRLLILRSGCYYYFDNV